MSIFGPSLRLSFDTECLLNCGDTTHQQTLRVVEALVRHGVFVDVWYHRNSFAQELPGAADFGHEIRFRDLYSWSTGAFQRAHRIPDEERRGGQRFGQLVKTGSMAGVCQVELYKTQIGDGKTR